MRMAMGKQEKKRHGLDHSKPRLFTLRSLYPQGKNIGTEFSYVIQFQCERNGIPLSIIFTVP